MPTTALALLNQPSSDAPPHTEELPPFALVDPADPHVRVLDLGVTRGDGVFETISVGSGHPQALEAHLRRFARSAAALELPAPDEQAWNAAVRAAAAAIDPVPEAYVKTILTRGVEGDGRPTGWAYAAPAEDFTAARRDGIRVVLLDRGYRHDVAQTSPWLLQGAKSLSYAVNRAVVREAKRRGADDVVFVSSDGYLLEGSTSNLLLRVGDTLITPGTNLGILPGTTQGDLFAFAAERGLGTDYALLHADDLMAADAAWLVSSVRHAAPIREVDGTPRAIDADFTSALNAFLVARTE
ncbi:aminodeoxychorismate lyase [Naasia aerilata]|uniref:4-amino-4-deoxychorismate lyase n=1 Tax=Naasia aerilata TaxID=1162966 RepID=A0ABM8GCS2_9MICO|nr:aminodeoxychorismate lyase [Naasia aerilata]BDZ46024.1 4-amino-4-deoxychorismate lyase [Naasia aerilata]